MKILNLIIAVIIIVSFKLNSQSLNDTNIIFVDYVPDITLTNNNDTLSIDVNQDGILDYKFYYVTYSGGRYPYFKNLNTDCQFSAFAANSNDSLNDPSIIWHTGDWFWYNDIIFGLKFIFGNNIYYGWVHAGSFPATMIIDQYAFCKIPNYPFHLGQTTLTSVSKNLYTPDSITVHLENSGNTVIVQSGKIIKRVILTSINGIEVATQSNINSCSARINVTGIARGAYILQVQFKDITIITKQIVL